MYSSSAWDDLVAGLEVVKHADTLGEDGSSVLDGEVARVERVVGSPIDQAMSDPSSVP